MNFRRRLLLLAVLVAPFASACGGASASGSAATTTAAQGADGTYAVVLSRPDRVGVQVHYVRDRTRSLTRTIRMQGAVVDSNVEASSSHLAGIFESLESDGRGRALHFKVRLEAWEVTTAEGKTNRLRAGQVIEVWRAPTRDEARMLVDGAPADAALKEEFDELVTLVSDKPGDDDLFGSDARRRIGETWSIDGTKFAALASAETMRIDPALTRGSVRLVDRHVEDGIDGLSLAFQIQSTGLELVGIPNLTSRGGRLMSTGTAFVPLDVQLPEPHNDFEMRMEVQADVTTPNGPAQVTIALLERDTGAQQVVSGR